MSSKVVARVFVLGNEKGGAGKTTSCIHLITSLLYNGYRVASIDTDIRQASLTSYIRNRANYNSTNDNNLICPRHFHYSEDNPEIYNSFDRVNDWFLSIFDQLVDIDYIVIDTPGSHSVLSKVAHSYADTIITPMNDSFLDLDVLAKVKSDDLSIITPSIYSHMVWEQKMKKASRDGGTIDWIIMRNRLSNLDAINKRKVLEVLDALSRRIGFKIAPGFSERVIFRELFLYGATLLDIGKMNHEINFSISHVAAKQELRDFLSFLGIVDLKV